ncbi:hypothetical protein LTR15_010977 [Elasticomyces elasticus]|nr:hypothetical protein LTR15_010977 [Elasticomyces elasticus]
MSTDQDAAATTITQDSPLLSLAPEIRNAIYDQVFKDSILINYQDRIVLQPPTLAKVCRQIRAEYKGVFRDEARRHVNELEVHIINFNFHDNISKVEAALQRRYEDTDDLREMLPWLNPIIVRVCVVITNTLEQSLP